MSFESVDRVFQNVSDTTPLAQSVLVALAHCRNHKTGACHPSIATLSRMTHFSESSVKNARQELKERKYISWTTTYDPETKTNTKCNYTLNLPSSSKGARVALEDGTTCPTGGQQVSGGGGTTRLHNQNIQPEYNQNTTSVVGDVGLFEEFWKAYPQFAAGRPLRTEGNKKQACKTYADFRAHYEGGGEAFDKVVMKSLEEWRVCEQWSKDGGRYIPNPQNFLNKKKWNENPTPDAQPEEDPLKREVEELIAAAKTDRGMWVLCEERCANYSDCKCSTGHSIPPAMDPQGERPPEECKEFTALPSGGAISQTRS